MNMSFISYQIKKLVGQSIMVKTTSRSDQNLYNMKVVMTSHLNRQSKHKCDVQCYINTAITFSL